MKYFALFAVFLIGLAQAAPAVDVWELFKTAHQKTYETETEELLRKEVFLNNVLIVEEHNKKFEAGEVSFEMGLNQFADLTEGEYRTSMLGFRIPEGHQSGANDTYIAEAGLQLPSEVDWRKKGVVTPIKNQASCGSCWSFSTTGAVEGAHAIKTGNLVSLSEQQLVDCDEQDNGCSGGLPEHGFQYIISAGGLDSESEYPYISGKYDKAFACKFKKSEVKATISSFKRVKSGDEDALKQAVATVGPVSVGIDDLRSFHLYSKGIYYDPGCGSAWYDLHHAVLVIGYGTENGQDYWLVKNSWGSGWGEKGFGRMARNRNNNCGIATDASFPVA